NALIDRNLIIHEFKSQGHVISEEYINERVNDVVHDEYNGDRNAFLKTLNERHVSLDKYREEIEDNAIVGYVRNREVTGKLRKYYQDHLDLFPQDEQLNVTFITVWGDSRHAMDDHSGNPKYALARQALDQVKQGADFSELVKKYNEDKDQEPT